jgi:hypothetical protein
MNLKACPDCGGDLGKNSIKCRCGWKAPGTAFTSPEVKPRNPCAADPACRFPGRLWHSQLLHDQRICIDHYYSAIERNHALGDDPTAPPKTKMLGVRPKQVAGVDA